MVLVPQGERVEEWKGNDGEPAAVGLHEVAKGLEPLLLLFPKVPNIGLPDESIVTLHILVATRLNPMANQIDQVTVTHQEASLSGLIEHPGFFLQPLRNKV